MAIPIRGKHLYNSPMNFPCRISAKYIFCFFMFILFFSRLLSAESPEYLFASGKQAFDRGDFPAALDNFTTLLENYPVYGKADEAGFLSALAEYYRQRYAACISKLLPFRESYPFSELNGTVQYWLGMCYYHQGLYEKAADHFEQQLSDPGKNYYIDALYYKGLSLMKKGDRKAADAEFSRIVSADYPPETQAEKEYVANLLYQYGTSEFSRKNYREAVIYFRKLLIAYPAYRFSYNVSFYIAECYYLQGNYDYAWERYKNALELFPSSPHREICLFRLAEIFYTLGRFSDSLEYLLLYEAGFPDGKFIDRIIHYKAPVYFELHRYSEAIPCYIRLLESAPEQERQLIFYNLGLAAQNTARYELAEQCFHFSLNGADPAIAENSLLKLAGIYREQELDREVIRALEVFREKFPGSLSREQVNRALALNYMKTGDAESALQAWNELISGFSQSFYRDEYLLHRALVCIQLSRYKEALEDLQTLITLFPVSRYAAEADYNIGYIYTIKYEYARAFEYYDKALASEPDAELRDRTLLAEGINHYNLGSYREALETFNTTSPEENGGKWRSILLYCKGMSYLKLGRKEKAAASFSRAGEYLRADPGILNYWRGNTGTEH